MFTFQRFRNFLNVCPIRVSICYEVELRLDGSSSLSDLSEGR